MSDKLRPAPKGAEKTGTCRQKKPRRGMSDKPRPAPGGAEKTVTCRQIELKAAIKDSQNVIVEVVNVVGQKIDRLEKTISDVRAATAQNSFDVQILRGKAQ